MAALTVTEWVSMSTAVIGTLVAVLTLVLQQRGRRLEDRAQRAAEGIHAVDRWEHDEVSRATTRSEAEHAHVEASRRRGAAQENYDSLAAALPAKGRRRSYKAIAATILGVLSLLGAMSLVGAAELTGEPVTAGDAAGTLFYGAIALILGLSARRDIKGDPGRGGTGLARTGFGSAALGALILAGSSTSMQNPPVADPPLTPVESGVSTDPTTQPALAGAGAADTPAPTDSGDVTGAWSGTLTDGSTEEDVVVTILSFDGFDDGTMTTVSSDGTSCDMVLAHAQSQNGAEFFAGTDTRPLEEGGCLEIAVAVQFDPSAGVLLVREEWVTNGVTTSLSGQLSPV